MPLHDWMPFRLTRLPEQARLRTIGNGHATGTRRAKAAPAPRGPSPCRPRPAPDQARSSPAKLVPSGARFAVGAGAALESSFRDLTIPNVIRSMITLTGRAAAMEAV